MNNERATGECALPQSWVWTTVGACAEVVTGNTPSKKDPANYGDYLPLVKPPQLADRIIADAEDGLSPKGAEKARILPAESVLVSCIGILGKTAMNSVPVAFNQQINAMIFPPQVLPKFGFYYFQSSAAKREMASVASATTVTIVNKSKFQRIPLPLAPLPEQHRIVAEIETQFTRLDAGVAALKRAQANLRRYKASVLKAACEGRLVATEAELARAEGRDYEPAEVLLECILTERRARWEQEHPGKRYKVPEPPDTTGLPELPEGWAWASVAQLAKSIEYGHTTRALSEPVGPRLLRITDIQRGQVDWNTVPFCECTEKQHSKYRLRFGDIVFARTGATTGKSYLITQCPDAIFASYLIRLQLASLTDSKFVSQFFGSPAYWSQIMVARIGSAQPGVNATKLATLHIPLPPHVEQMRIVTEVERRLSVVTEMERQVEVALRRTERLRQAILKSAFEGKMVSQDPSDEPAAALLERIRTQTETSQREPRQMRLPST